MSKRTAGRGGRAGFVMRVRGLEYEVRVVADLDGQPAVVNGTTVPVQDTACDDWNRLIARIAILETLSG